jgi:hypothetical protein
VLSNNSRNISEQLQFQQKLARTNGDATNAASIWQRHQLERTQMFKNTAIGVTASAITARALARTNGDATNAANF